MRILQINCVYSKGSTGNIVKSIHNTLLKNGIDSYVAFGAGHISDERINVISSKLKLKISALKSRLFGKHGFYNILDTRKFIKWINHIKPDIIHLHNLHGNYLNVEVLFNYIHKKNIKVIWTLHDCWAFTGHCVYFDYIGCEKWKNECNKCPLLKEYPHSYIFDTSKKLYNKKKKLYSTLEITFITPSHWLQSMVKQSFLGKNQVQTIYNGINLDIFKPRKSNFRQAYSLHGKFIILGVSFGWSKRKGIDVFIELAHVLPCDYSIVLVGVDDKLSAQLPKNIITIKKTTNQIELAEIYSAADLFVNPTREEVLGMVNIESIACGTPVLTFDSGGSPESLNDFVGRVIDRDDIAGLIREIQIIKNNRQSVSKNLAEFQKRAKDFDENIKYLEYLSLYKKVYQK